MSSDGVPEVNLEIYTLLYKIEVALRECIIENLETHFGKRCWHQRLPQDVADSYRKGRAYERGVKWFTMISHHPIYYTEFPDLKKIILKSDNWREVFQEIFKDQVILNGLLSSLEPIRNKIAHNRKATAWDLDTTKSVCERLVTALGRKHFDVFLERCTCEPDIAEILTKLILEGEHAFDQCHKCEPILELHIWSYVKDQWWFDDDYLGINLVPITVYYETLLKYGALPRYRGTGHKLQDWIYTNEIESKYNACVVQLTNLLEGIHNGLLSDPKPL